MKYHKESLCPYDGENSCAINGFPRDLNATSCVYFHKDVFCPYFKQMKQNRIQLAKEKKKEARAKKNSIIGKIRNWIARQLIVK
jgi:hypothetical protein